MPSLWSTQKRYADHIEECKTVDVKVCFRSPSREASSMSLNWSGLKAGNGWDGGGRCCPAQGHRVTRSLVGPCPKST